MAYGARVSNPNTHDVTLSEYSYTMVFIGKPWIVYSQLVMFLDPPFGRKIVYGFVADNTDIPVVYMSMTTGIMAVCAYSEHFGDNYWEFTVYTSQDGIFPELYVFRRLHWDDAVRGGYGVIIWGPDGRPVFSSNRLMLDPVASMVAPTPESNMVPYYSGGTGVYISDSKTVVPWPPGTRAAYKPIVMCYSNATCILDDGIAGATALMTAVRVFLDRFEVSWVPLGYTPGPPPPPAVAGDPLPPEVGPTPAPPPAFEIPILRDAEGNEVPPDAPIDAGYIVMSVADGTLYD